MEEISLAKLKNPRKKFDASQILFCASFIVFAIILVVPWLVSSVHSGHDIEYHLSMIRSFDDAWKSGNFFSKINNLACQDYGYGNSLFYAAIPSGIAVLFMHLFNLGITGAVGLEMIVLFSLNGLVFYFLTKRMFKNNKIAFVCSLLYMFTPYVLNQFYVRFSFSEIFLSLAIPLIFLGLNELFMHNNAAGFIVFFSLGYALAIMCHLTVTVYLTVFVAIYLCFHLKEIFKGGKIVPLIIASVIALLISASFYIPMLINFKDSIAIRLNMTSEFLSFNGLWSFVIPWLLFTTIISLIMIVSMGKQLRFYKGENDKNSKCLFVLLNLSFICSTCIFPWFLLPNFVGMIQYVWRLFAVNSVFIYLTLGYLIQKHGFKNLMSRIVVIVLISACSFAGNCYSAVKGGASWFTNTSVAVSMYENTISNQSDNYGIGSHKKLNYTPKVSTQSYIFGRANDKMILNCNVKVKEFATYFGLNQISFIVDHSRNSFVVVNLPYEVAQGAEFYQLTTDVSSTELKIQTTSEKIGENNYLKLILADSAEESKITISLDDTLREYLIKNPYEFIVREGEAVATNFIKKNASTYTVEFKTDGAKIELPTLYYNGYKLNYTTADGTKEIKPICDENGFIEIELSESGTLSVEFDAGYVKIGNLLSVVGCGTLVVCFVGSAIIQLIIKKKKKAK